MRIADDKELQALKAAGRVVRRALDAMSEAVAPGVSTGELDAIAGEVFRAHGARSAPRLVYDFPGETCISVNDEIVHGIPSRRRRLAEGDLVKLDVTVELDGFMADAAVTRAVGRVPERARRLVACAEKAFRAGLREARPGRLIRDIGAAVEDEVRKRGFSVVRVLTGHGIGRTIHENPMVPNWADPGARTKITEGLVITIEPILAMGSGESWEDDDGWTIRTTDGSPASHYEHTIVVTAGEPLLLTR